MQPQVMPSSIWQNDVFRRIFTAQLLAEFGAQISFLALPLIASTLLGASPLQMGLLTAVNALPPLLLGLHAGVFIDRRSKRPILIASDLARMVLICALPVAWLGDWLSMSLLIAVSLAVGACSLVFSIAYQAFLPMILYRETLLSANSSLELSRSAAEIAGPGFSGWLIGVASAPMALLANAATYLGSALVLKGVPADTPPRRDRHHDNASLGNEIRAGIATLFGHPTLRAVMMGGAMLEFFNAMADTLFILFVTQELGLSPAAIGLVFAVSSVGFALGAILPHRLASMIGFGQATILALALIGASDLLIPLAHGTTPIVVMMLATAQLVFGAGLTIFKVNRATIRQVLVPDDMQGRAAATMRVISASLIPFGALAGGLAGTQFGLRETLVVAALGEIGAALWLLRSPFRRIVKLDTNTID